MVSFSLFSKQLYRKTVDAIGNGNLVRQSRRRTPKPSFFKNGIFTASFYFRCFITADSKQINVRYKSLPMTGLNCRPQPLEVTALPTEPQPLAPQTSWPTKYFNFVNYSTLQILQSRITYCYNYVKSCDDHRNTWVRPFFKHSYGRFEHSSQCDQIGRFLKGLGNKFSFKSGPDKR